MNISAFECPQENGYFRHPTDQHRFFLCIDGREYEYHCPANLVWNQSIHQCDYTTGPEDIITTTPTIPHGDRSRHTIQPTRAIPTEPNEIVTRGRHHLNG